MLNVDLVGCTSLLESQCKDTAISRYHLISACNKARFSARFQSEPVKQSNSPFCAPQLILFQKRKHRVKEKKTQHLIQYSVIQFFFKGLLPPPLKSKVYILSIYLYIYKYLLAELKNRLKISIFLWRKSCASR